MTDWVTKNERRRKAKQANPRKYAEGRWNRKNLVLGGAFGTASAKLYNMCITGVGAEKRTSKKDRDDYDNRTDYDS